MKSGRFQALPIRHKLVAMIMLTALTALLLASAGYLLTDYFRTRAEVQRDLETQAGLALESAHVMVDFLDQQGAIEALRPLRSNPHLEIACLYKPDGSLFLQFPTPAVGPPCESTVPAEDLALSLDSLEIVETYRKEGRLSGSLYLRSGLRMIWEQQRMQAFIVLALLVLAAGVGFLLSAKLQTLVSEPILRLARTAAQVSVRGDYSLRAARTTDDELGELVDAFNRMLERIQLREAELSKANEDLRHEVTERKRAEQERAELLVREREANRLKDEFLATLSHELRTPLNAILGWTKLLRADAVPEAAVGRALEKVERNAQIQSRLVEDLLEVSRIVSGKLHLEMRSVDLVSILDRAVDSIRPAAEAKSVALERQYGSSPLITVGDPDRLQQVVWNLLSNAVKFTPSGGIVRIGLDRESLFDRIVVADTGIGIEPEFLPNVFETFRQADASSTRTYGGLGLGLSIVRHLVEMHGGVVDAESSGPDSGATFTVRLPVRAPEPGTALVDPASAGSLAGFSILVIDDDPEVRDSLTSALQRAGARVHAAASLEAVAAIVDMLPDALVCDPDAAAPGGERFLARINAVLGTRAPRVAVAVTTDDDGARVRAAGFHRHVVKPVEPDTVVRLLEDLLASSARDGWRIEKR